MSDKKISQLASVTNLIGTELVPIVQGGVTSKTTIGLINKLAKTYLTITKALADTLIAGNNLIPGSYYKITGVNPTLYNDGTNSGTAVILQAISFNQFATGGHGIFYNPKYNQSIDGFGVFSDRSTWSVDTGDVIGIFNTNEYITGDGGQTGRLFGGIASGIFIALTGDWTTVISITGDDTGATVPITNVVLKSYVFGEKVIWGGYSWVNVTGNVGSKLDILTLNADWTKVPYSLTDYNLVNDIITYDYQNDFISSRLEVNGGNYVETTFNGNWNEEYGWPPISVFMWGNPYDYNTGKGIGYNKSVGSWFECVDFYGNYIYNNNFINDSVIQNNTFVNGSSIYHNTLNYGFYSDNTFISSSFRSNTLNDSNVQNNALQGSSYKNNTLNNSFIVNNNFINVDMQDNTLQASIFDALLNSIAEKIIQKTYFNGVNAQVDLSLSTIIFGDYTKNVFSTQNGSPRLSYFDNTDTLVVVNVNA